MKFDGTPLPVQTKSSSEPFLGIDACFVFRDESDESSFSLQTKGQRTKPAKHFPCASILRWVVPFLYVVSGTSDHFKKSETSLEL